jgi:Nucleotide modification associated domain 2
MRLFSYCLRYDDGAAPNPFWGVCTLTICKPAIRRAAQVGDWIVGLGSAHSPIGDISDYVVYAMRVTAKLNLRAYDEYCRLQLPHKIPRWRSRDFRRRVGDCIHDYALGEPPRLRDSVHSEGSRDRDLGGRYALLSTHFYYFGDQPVQLCDELAPIIHGQQGHKSTANQPYAAPFVSWIESLGYEPNVLHGEPQLKPLFHQPSAGSTCAPGNCDHKIADEVDISPSHCAESPTQEEHAPCDADHCSQPSGAARRGMPT